MIPLIGAAIGVVGAAITNKSNQRATEKANAQNREQNEKFNDQQRKDTAAINKQTAQYAAERDAATDAHAKDVNAKQWAYNEQRDAVLDKYARERDAASDAYINARDAASDSADEREFGERQRQFDANHAVTLDQADFLREQFEASKQPVTTTNSLNLDVLRAEAEAAGFNPYSLVRAGLGGAFSTSTTTGQSSVVGTVTNTGFTGGSSGASSAGGLTSVGLSRSQFAAMGLQSTGLNLQQAGVAAPPLASAAVHQDVLGAGLGAYTTLAQLQVDPEREALERDLMRAEIDGYQNRAQGQSPWAFGIPSVSSSSGIGFPPISEGAGSSRYAGRPTSLEGETALRLAEGFTTNPDPNFSDAEFAETRWGELGGSLYGLGVMASDLGRTARSGWDQFVSPTLSRLRENNQSNEPANITQAGRDWIAAHNGPNRGVITRGGNVTDYGRTVGW